MELKELEPVFSICTLSDQSLIERVGKFSFVAETDEEISLVCPSENMPPNTLSRSDGWKGFRVVGELGFSLIGILAALTKILADNQIGIFALSTYRTDYIFTKEEQWLGAKNALIAAGYRFI